MTATEWVWAANSHCEKRIDIYYDVNVWVRWLQLKLTRTHILSWEIQRPRIWSCVDMRRTASPEISFTWSDQAFDLKLRMTDQWNGCNGTQTLHLPLGWILNTELRRAYLVKTPVLRTKSINWLIIESVLQWVRQWNQIKIESKSSYLENPVRSLASVKHKDIAIMTSTTLAVISAMKVAHCDPSN